MPRDVTPPVPRPIFQEPVFNEAVVSGDPADFRNLILRTMKFTSRSRICWLKM